MLLNAKGEIMKIHTSFGYRHGKLTTVILSIIEPVETAIDCNYIVEDPKEAEKQIAEWKKKHST